MRKSAFFPIVMILAAAFGASGCQSGRNGDTTAATDIAHRADVTGPGCTVDRFTQPTEPPPTQKLDVLFVMDHSESMKRHWLRIARNIGRLVHEFPANQDIRYAVILGDLEPYSTGRLFTVPGVPKVLDRMKMSDDQISLDLERIFDEGVEHVAWTSAGEALFYSTYEAATSHAADIEKQGFFRSDAALDVIFMSDDAEEGYPYPEKQFWDLPPKCNWLHHEHRRLQYYVPRGINVDSTYAALVHLKGAMPVMTNAFVNITREDITIDNRLDAKCIFDSPGLGYFDIVKKTGGVLYSIHKDLGDGLTEMGQYAAGRLSDLQHDFILSTPAALVDPATIVARVDGVIVPFTYSAATDTVHLDNAGHEGSVIEITHCTPPTASPSPSPTPTVVPPPPPPPSPSPSPTPTVLPPPPPPPSPSPSPTPTVLPPPPPPSPTPSPTPSPMPSPSPSPTPTWAITNVAAAPGDFSAQLTWDTLGQATIGQVRWGMSGDALTQASAPEGQAVTSHSLVIDGLAPRTTYFYQVISTDPTGLVQRGPVLSFTTTSQPT